MMPKSQLSVVVWGIGKKRGRAFEIFLGMIGALGFAPFYLAPLTLIVLALIGLRLYHLHRQSYGFKAGFKTGWCFGFGLFLAGLYWIGSAFAMRPGGYIYLAIPMVGGLMAFLSLFWGFAAGLIVRLRPLKLWAFSISLMCAFFIAEYIRGHWLGGLPWNLPGYIIQAGHPLSQISSVIGIYGQSLMVLLWAGGLMICLGARGRTRIIAGGVALAMLVGSWAYGAVRLPNGTPAFIPDAKLRLVTVDFSQRDQFDREKSLEIIREFIRQSVAPGFEDISHVVWPEGAVGGVVIENENLINAVGQSFLNFDADSPPFWVFNSLRHETRRAADGQIKNLYYNSAVEIDFSQTAPRLTGFSDKIRLVPFGEFIPFAETLEKIGLGTLSSAIGSMTPAAEKIHLNLSGLPPVNSLICYEGIFPELSRRAMREAASAPKWILNLSNDGWYGRLSGPYQHANQTRYRAIETGLPLVRASAGCESGVYDAYGRALKLQPSRATGVVDINIPNQSVQAAISFQSARLILLITLSILVMSILTGSRISK
jgi:apolipoprotein N-acyltransferase